MQQISVGGMDLEYFKSCPARAVRSRRECVNDGVDINDRHFFGNWKTLVERNRAGSNRVPCAFRLT